MPNVVVILEGGAVQRILVDDEQVKVLVIDRDYDLTSRECKLADVLGEPAALDALAQAANGTEVDPQQVAQAFNETRECLELPELSAHLRELSLHYLGDRFLEGIVGPKLFERVQRRLASEAFNDVELRQAGEDFVLHDSRHGRDVVRFAQQDGKWVADVMGYTAPTDATPIEHRLLSPFTSLNAAVAHAIAFVQSKAAGPTFWLPV